MFIKSFMELSDVLYSTYQSCECSCQSYVFTDSNFSSIHINTEINFDFFFPFRLLYSNNKA